MPISVPDLPAAVRYEGEDGCASWAGYVVDDEGAFRSFVQGPVAERARDEEAQEDFEEELLALATTGVETAFLARFFAAVPEEKDWEVGEALAESILTEDTGREVIFPWNESRDRKTPQASLPGADLVGFCRDASGFALLFGEVKTSSDAGSPPQVMYGRSGMAWQLEAEATRLDVQHALLRWLRLRCLTPALLTVYQEAVTRYLRSSGKDILIIGVLLRDTPCTERDIQSRARYLAGTLCVPTRVEIMAWYLPVAISEWPDLLGEDA
ncbi:MAG: hypothetical protein JXB39_06635 [Deltaproteobacteria bacterium]|nr:hypothetical protein [Deltaproteobacteria bacterium]